MENEAEHEKEVEEYWHHLLTTGEITEERRFRNLINRFYKASSAELIRYEAIIDRLVGDQMVGYFIPGFAGQEHARKAIESAKAILDVTGHGDTKGPWIPVGVGVHTGTAFLGTVGSEEGVTDFTALGDAVNAAARLASKAATGELLVSEAAYSAAAMDIRGLEERNLMLKGRSEPLRAVVIRK